MRLTPLINTESILTRFCYIKITEMDLPSAQSAQEQYSASLEAVGRSYKKSRTLHFEWMAGILILALYNLDTLLIETSCFS